MFQQLTLRARQVAVMHLDLEGAQQLRAGSALHAVIVWVRPPSMDALSRRLPNRDSLSPQVTAHVTCLPSSCTYLLFLGMHAIHANHRAWDAPVVLTSGHGPAVVVQELEHVLGLAQQDLEHASAQPHLFDYVIENDLVDQAYREVRSVAQSIVPNWLPSSARSPEPTPQKNDSPDAVITTKTQPVGTPSTAGRALPLSVTTPFTSPVGCGGGGVSVLTPAGVGHR